MAAYLYLGFVALFVFYTFQFPGEERRNIPLASAEDIVSVAVDTASDLQERWAEAIGLATEQKAEAEAEHEAEEDVHAETDVSNWYIEGTLEDPVLVLE